VIGSGLPVLKTLSGLHLFIACFQPPAVILTDTTILRLTVLVRTRKWSGGVDVVVVVVGDALPVLSVMMMIDGLR